MRACTVLVHSKVVVVLCPFFWQSRVPPDGISALSVASVGFRKNLN